MGAHVPQQQAFGCCVLHPFTCVAPNYQHVLHLQQRISEPLPPARPESRGVASARSRVGPTAHCCSVFQNTAPLCSSWQTVCSPIGFASALAVARGSEQNPCGGSHCRRTLCNEKPSLKAHGAAASSHLQTPISVLRLQRLRSKIWKAGIRRQATKANVSSSEENKSLPVPQQRQAPQHR